MGAWKFFSSEKGRDAVSACRLWWGGGRSRCNRYETDGESFDGLLDTGHVHPQKQVGNGSSVGSCTDRYLSLGPELGETFFFFFFFFCIFFCISYARYLIVIYSKSRLCKHDMRPECISINLLIHSETLQ